MSEKRILIQESDENPCLSCTNDDCKYPCEAKQQWGLGAGHKGPEKIYKRREAVQIIAKAICRTDGEDCETCGFNGNEKGCKQYLKIGNYITQAEVVLEDILEVHNDEK